MKKLTGLLAIALIIGTSGIAMAAETATQTVTYAVSAINELGVTGSPTLTVNAAVAGAAPTAVSDATSSYDITTNEELRKITGAIDLAMPTGVTLTANLAAPTGGTSAGALELTATAQDFVTAISTLNETGKVITYGLSATSAAGVVAQATKTVTFTIAATQ